MGLLAHLFTSSKETSTTRSHGNLNRYHGTHALRERASKIKQGIIIVRFEMPFNVWCQGCNNHVAMSVRYNAEKKKVGNYYTTPIYEFRMKCHLCDNYFTMRTDPKNFDYECVEGLVRQELRFDPADIDNLGAVDRTLQQKLAGDAMFKAEHLVDDKKKSQNADGQIVKLEQIQGRMKDAYGANCDLRRQFRAEKKLLNEKRASDQDLKKRMSFEEVPLLPSSQRGHNHGPADVEAARHQRDGRRATEGGPREDRRGVHLQVESREQEGDRPRAEDPDDLRGTADFHLPPPSSRPRGHETSDRPHRLRHDLPAPPRPPPSPSLVADYDSDSD
ncbi:hypothetical protein M3Y99_00188000 [Aphelenchoides fujianensis]|nr:hypothetical protein M3Y99_00188000 [Aphelenchoides fujianensis]